MTRYRLDILDGDYGLSNKDISFLFQFLFAKITKNVRQKINKKICSMQITNRDYGLLQLSQNVLVGIIKTENAGCFMNLGYPFPISIKKINIKFPGYTVNFYLRGENIRGRQRKYVFSYLGNTNVHKFIDKTEFKKKLKQTYSNYANSLLYIDLYRFIGDGILGLYFIDNLRKYFNTLPTDTHVFSKNNRHMPSLYNVHNTSELDNFIQTNDNFTIVIPNLLDNQFNDFINIINKLKNQNALVIIPSRNMYIEINNQNTNIFWYKTPDVLLKNQPIVDYMQESISVFMDKQKENNITIHAINSKNVFIDPFSSLKEKTIPVKECLVLCNRLIDCGFNIFMSNGVNQDVYTKQFIKYGVKIIKDKGLNDLAHTMQEYDIGFVISTDSSIAHLSAYLHIPTIVLYRSYFWDPNTIQSMTNDSPGGFCRADLPMFPIVDGTADDIINILAYFRNKQKYAELTQIIKKFDGADNKTVLAIHNKLMGLGNVSNAYNPDVLLRGVLNASNNHNTWQIARNIWENVPEYKISKFYRC